MELFLGSTSASVDWEAEAYPTYGDFAVLPLLVAFFPAVRFLLDRLIFEVISCFLQVPWILNAVLSYAISVTRVVVCNRWDERHSIPFLNSV